MLDLTLFRRHAFTGANIVAFALSSSIFAMFLYLTLYIQDVLGYGALQAGLRFLPITMLSFIVAPIAGRLTVRVPVRLLLGGGLLLVSGGLLAMTAVEANSGWTVLIPGFVLAGAGIGMINPPLASTAIGVVHYSRSGMASGINSTFRQVGIVTGIAGLGAIFAHEVSHTVNSRLAASGQGHAVQSAAHGHLSKLLQSGEVGKVLHALPPVPQAALGARLPRRLHRSLHHDPRDRRRRRLRRRGVRLRAGAQPRLRQLRRAAASRGEPVSAGEPVGVGAGRPRCGPSRCRWHAPRRSYPGQSSTGRRG